MKKNRSKGFTIIELLVVVAIVAVLTGIVVSNTTKYISRGKNSSIQGDMSSMLTSAAVWYENNNSTYAGFTASTGYTTPATAVTANGGGTLTAVESLTAFCACAKLNDTTGAIGQTFCIDSTGNKKQTSTACGDGTASDTTACTTAGVCL